MKNIAKAFVLIGGLFGVSFVHAQQAATLYENVRVFNGTADKLSAPTNVLVVGNTIKTISSKPIEIPQGIVATRIAGDGRTLMPGLIDAHAHLYLGVAQSLLFDPKTTPALLDQKAYDSSKATLMSGFTTVRDMGGPMFKFQSEFDAFLTKPSTLRHCLPDSSKYQDQLLQGCWQK